MSSFSNLLGRVRFYSQVIRPLVVGPIVSRLPTLLSVLLHRSLSPECHLRDKELPTRVVTAQQWVLHREELVGSPMTISRGQRRYEMHAISLEFTDYPIRLSRSCRVGFARRIRESEKHPHFLARKVLALDSFRVTSRLTSRLAECDTVRGISAQFRDPRSS